MSTTKTFHLFLFPSYHRDLRRLYHNKHYDVSQHDSIALWKYKLWQKQSTLDKSNLIKTKWNEYLCSVGVIYNLCFLWNGFETFLNFAEGMLCVGDEMKELWNLPYIRINFSSVGKSEYSFSFASNQLIPENTQVVKIVVQNKHHTYCVSLVITWMSSSMDLLLEKSGRQWISYNLA